MTMQLLDCLLTSALQYLGYQCFTERISDLPNLISLHDKRVQERDWWVAIRATVTR